MNDLKNSVTAFSAGLSAFDILRELVDAFGIDSVKSSLDELDTACKHENMESTIYGTWCKDCLEFVVLK